MFEDSSFDSLQVPSQITRRRKRRYPRWLVAVYFAALMVLWVAALGAVVWVRSLHSPKNDPSSAAEAWYQAMAQGDTERVEHYTCGALDFRIAITSAAAAWGLAGGTEAAFGVNVALDISGLEFANEAVAEDRAFVRSSGSLRYVVEGIPITVPGNLRIEMRREGDHWTVCDDFNPITP